METKVDCRLQASLVRSQQEFDHAVQAAKRAVPTIRLAAASLAMQLAIIANIRDEHVEAGKDCSAVDDAYVQTTQRYEMLLALMNARDALR